MRWLTLFLLLQFLHLLSNPAHATPYTYQTYAQIHARLVQLAADHPKLLRLYSAQDRFSLPHVGNCSQYVSGTEQTMPCTVWVVEMTNFDTLPKSHNRPHLLFSGELHGDEVIGPHAILAYIEYMAAHYETDPFVTRMVNTRLVTLVPMTNAIGFFSNKRHETQADLELDPNRDFPYDQNPSKCMQTVAARVINELFRVHIFRLLITFHGGTNVIGYEWGDTSHCNGADCHPAPDTLIMAALARRMRDNAGRAGNFEAEYEVGDMGSTVYSVKGGLEDWAYGASWTREAVSCNPNTLQGYPVEKTKIERITKRCVTYLVETAKEKKPPEHTLGTNESILHRGAPGDGHVPRNLRLLFSVVDAAEPYIVLDNSPKTSDGGHPALSWVVGGAFIVTGSMIQYSTVNGTRWGWMKVMNGTAGVATAGSSGTTFTQALNFSSSIDEPMFFRVVAVVDTPFSKMANGSSPAVSPQSHLIGSRVSDKWAFSVGEHNIQGRLVFFSDTVKIEKDSTGHLSHGVVDDALWSVSKDPGSLRTQSDHDLYKIVTQHVNHHPNLIPVHGTSMTMRTTILTAIGGVVAVLAIGISIYVFIRRKRVRPRRNKSSFALEDDMDYEETRVLTHSEEGEREVVELTISSSRARKQDFSHV